MQPEPALNSMACVPTPAIIGANADRAMQVAATLPAVGKSGIKIGRATLKEAGAQAAEVFTMTLDQETIPLVPLRSWGQLDTFKWCVRGKLPGIPAGLEVTLDHIKIEGQTVSLKDSDACSRLERIFNEWLALEKATLENVRNKTQVKPEVALRPTEVQRKPERARFHVEADKRGQVHIQCFQGKEQLAAVGLSVLGINSLVNQGLMRKPRTLKVGALHDWIELDGVLCSFEKGRNDTAALEQILNERYLPASTLGQGKDIVILANAASSTGFDIQFPVTVAGVPEARRRHLAEDALELLQDPEKSGLLQPGRILKLTRPCLIFKQRTADGGERYLEQRPENVVIVPGDDGSEKRIDLSRPVNYMHLSAAELTAIFNHPVINRHTTTPAVLAEMDAEKTISPLSESKGAPQGPPPSVPAPKVVPDQHEPRPSPAEELAMAAETKRALEDHQGGKTDESIKAPEQFVPDSQERRLISPNAWLKSILQPEPIRHDWFASLIYSRLARKFGNSRGGTFGAGACWAIALSATKYISEPTFKGIFLTEKRGLGFLNRGHLARFNNGVAFIGTQDLAIQGVGIQLRAVAMDAQQRLVFIVNEGFRSKFGVPEQTVSATLLRLQQEGAVILGANEVLESAEPIEVAWTAPAQDQNAGSVQAQEHLKSEMKESG